VAFISVKCAVITFELRVRVRVRVRVLVGVLRIDKKKIYDDMYDGVRLVLDKRYEER
jgi:hypothetical protein